MQVRKEIRGDCATGNLSKTFKKFNLNYFDLHKLVAFNLSYYKDIFFRILGTTIKVLQKEPKYTNAFL